MRPTTSRALLAFLLLTAACGGHLKAGDQAAAVGDWKAAYASYRQAVADEPNDPALKQKYADARRKALDASAASAQACRVQGNWECVLNEADYTLSIEPGDLKVAAARRDAAHKVALGRVGQAEDLTARGDLPTAARLLGEARALSNDLDVDEVARAAERRWVQASIPEIERARAARRYGDAVALATTAASYDPSRRALLDNVTREAEAFRDAEHARFFQAGERAMSQGAWAEAASSFRAAQQARPDERARALEQHANLVVQGDQALSRGDFKAATRAYGDAAAMRLDRSGYAEAQLARVQVRPWAVKVRGVLVDPVRPDGTPWVGPPGPRLNRVGRELAGLAGGAIDARVLRAVNDVPRENRPELSVEVVLPGGQRLASRPGSGPLLDVKGTFIVMGNAFDTRRVALRVLHAEPGQPPRHVGEVSVPVGELVSRPAGTLSHPPLLALEVEVEPADGAAEGPGRGFAPVAEPPRPPPPGAQKPPPAPPAPAAPAAPARPPKK